MSYTSASDINSSRKYIYDMLGQGTPQHIALCRIEKVNPDATVDVTLVSEGAGTKTISRVRLASPYKYNDTGAIFMPEVGALAVIAIISDLYQIIIGYVNQSDGIVEEIANMEDGEFLFQTKAGSYIKFNDNKSIDIHSGENSTLVVGKDNILEATEFKQSFTVASENTQGMEGDIVYNIERCYDKDIESTLDNEELVQEASMSSTLGIDIIERVPILEIQKGNVVKNGEPVKLSLYEEEADNPDACYMIEVASKGVPCRIMIGKDGSVQVEGNVVKLKCEELDLTESDLVSFTNLNFIEK